jgi:hypothetical protein
MRQKEMVMHRTGVKQQICDGRGYAVTYYPARTFRAPPKVEIRLPGTEYTVIVTPNEEGHGCGIVTVNPQGGVTDIPVYADERELMRQAGLGREGLELATIFVPITVSDDRGPLPRRRIRQRDLWCRLAERLAGNG